MKLLNLLKAVFRIIIKKKKNDKYHCNNALKSIAKRRRSNLFKNKESLKGLSSLVKKMLPQFTEGRIPEPLSDMRIVLDAIRDYDPSKDFLKDNYRIRFWNREPGKDMFVGNCAGSCTSLSSNASAIFEFLLDAGTQYVLI